MPVTWMGYAVSSSLMFTIIVAGATPYSIDYIKGRTFFILLILTAASFPFFFFLTPETKDKSIKEIRRDYETDSKKEDVITEFELAKKTELPTERNMIVVFIYS